MIRLVSTFALVSLVALAGVGPAAAQVQRPMPVVQRVEPTSGPPGTEITLHGRHYDAAQTVWLGDAQLEVTSRFPNRWTARVPDGARAAAIEIRTARGNVQGPRFRVTEAAPAPTIEAFSPESGAAGTEVTISGANFSPRSTENTVHLGDRPVVVRRATPTELRVIVPTGVESGAFRVRVTGAGEATSEGAFTVGSGTTVASFEPVVGPPGTRVTLTGTGFDRRRARVRVYLGETRARVIQASETELTVEVPRRGASTGRWLVDVRGGGRAHSEASYEVRSPPEIEGLEPPYGAPGRRVTVRGANFGTDIRRVEARIGEAEARVRDIADDHVDIEIPRGAESGPVSITVGGMGPATSETELEVVPPVQVSGFRPRSGPVGTEVTVLGTGFATDVARDSVAMNGVTVPVVSATETELVVRVPEGSSGPLVVTVANAGEARTAHPFVITTPPTIAGFSPSSGPPGTEVTIRGTRFGNRQARVRVRLGERNVQIRRVTDSEIVVTIPARAETGALSVVVQLEGTATSEQPFTVQ